MTTTAEQQLILELINRARSNPSGEYDELVPSGVGITTEIQSALSFFNVDLAVLSGQLDGYDAAAPLAFNANLAQSAATHNDLMLANEQQSHSLPGELGLGDRIAAAGYEGALSLSESIYAYAYDPLYAHAGFYIDWGSTPTGIQDPAGHRNAMLNSSFTEVGIAWAEETDATSSIGPFVTTQHYGTRAGYEEQLLGVVYNDLDSDNFYDIGEGLGEVNITVFGENGTFVTASWASGGYQLVVPDGVYTVIFDGSGLGGIVVSTFTMAGENQKIDGLSDMSQGTGVDLTGFDGADDIIGTSLGDTLTGGLGDDTLNGGDSNDMLYGEAGQDVITGGSGKDKVYGGDDYDHITGGRSGDRLWGENGNDEIYGGIGNDKIYGGAGDDYLEGGSKKDKLFGGSGNDELHGGSGDDILKGGAKRDVLFGGSGDDELFGEFSRDTLDGGSGNDILTGGSSADVFVFDVGHDSDIIADFAVGSDSITLSAALANGQTAQQIVDGATTAFDGSIILGFGSGDEILLDGITDAAALADSIFIQL